MKKFLPILIFLCVVAIFFRSFLFKGLLPIPSDTIIGLYHPFRDLYAKNYPNGIPYKNFLITDPVRQQYPWRFLAVDQIKKMELPLWNPYVMAGYPLLGNYQSASFYPLNLLFLLLPFSTAWSFMIVLQPLLAGIFLYFYLRYLRLHPSAAALGAIVYALCGFSIAWLEWNTIINVALWLPLILLAIEKLLQKFTLKWAIILLFAQCSQILAGHLQVLFYSLVISNTYLFLRIWQSMQASKKQSKLLAFFHMYKEFFIIGLLALGITFLQWFPTLQFLLQSARDVDQNNWQKDGWFIPWQHLIQFIAPDFFGNPTTLNYWGTWNYGELVGYIGIFPLLMSLYAVFFRRDKKTHFFTILVFLSLLFSLPTGISQLPYIFNIPFLSTSQPTRLLFIVDFSLAILCALGLDYFIKQRKHVFFPSLLLCVFFGLFWTYILFGNKFISGVTMEQIITAKRNIILPTLLLFTIFVAFFVLHFIKKKTVFVTTISFFVILSSVDLLRFGDKFIPFTAKDYLFPTTKAINFLQQSGESRIMTLDSRILPPNFSVVYKLQSIDGYDPLYLRRYGEFVAALEREKPDIKAPFGFNRIITPHAYNSKLIDLLGVKYIISLSDIQDNTLKKVFVEGKTNIYENLEVFPRTFFVKKTTFFKPDDKEGVITAMFEKNVDFHDTAFVASTKYMQKDAKEWSSGVAKIVTYKENEVRIVTDNSGDGFLVLTDNYYPSWYATIDGKETEILLTDYTFRGIVVPQGKHTVIFSARLF